MPTWLETFESGLREEYGGTQFESWISGIVEQETGGIAASERVGDTWCRCEGSTEGQESYYRKPVKGTHGWFHDPAKGGCSGITQTG